MYFMDKIKDFQDYFLTSSDIWFNPQRKYDDYIKSNYGNLLDIKKNIINNITNDITSDITSNDIKFSIMLLYDQLPYYIYRDNFDKIREYQKTSKTIARYFIDNFKLNSFGDLHKVFILLALRHGNNLNDINESIRLVKNLRMGSNSNILKRFYKASLLKLGEINNKDIVDSKVYSEEINNDIIDINSKFSNFESMIKCEFTNTYLLTLIEKLNPVLSDNSICVSLSGGVDSMVLLYLLSHIQNIKLYAIHINYKNRDTSDDEMNLCIKFCNYLNVPIFVRNITEINRTRDKDRDIYEEVTRKIRFGSYKIIQEKYKCFISMGHNKDDCIENLFSNIIRKQKYDNLLGMDFLGSELNVNIVRPFLDITKDEIYKIALKYKLPYLYDSTPCWSDRGKKRDSLIPFLNNFDYRIIPGLIEISSRIKILYKNTHQNMIKMITFIDEENILCSIDKTIIEYDKEFYIDLFGYICKHYKIPFFKKKAIINLRNKILEKRNRNITLNKKYSFHNFNLIKLQ